MPGTDATLFDAFGVSAAPDQSALQQALSGFTKIGQPMAPKTDTPLQVGQAPQQGPYDFITQALNLSPAAPATQTPKTHPWDIIPQGVRDVAGTIGQATFSGSKFLDLVLPGTPGSEIKSQIAKVNGPLAEIADAVLSPATLATALKGLQIAGAVSKLPIVGPFAGTLVSPILHTKDASALARFGVEAATIGGGMGLNDIGNAVSNAIWNEDLPFAAQLGLSLFGGFSASKMALKSIVTGADAVGLIDKVHPNGVLSEIYKANPNLPANPSVADFAGLDTASRDLRSKTLETIAQVVPPSPLPANLPETVLAHMQFVQDTLQGAQTRLPNLMNEALANTPEKLRAWGISYDTNAGMFGNYLNGMGQLLDGNLGKNVIGGQIATIFHNLQTEVHNAIANGAELMAKDREAIFGKNSELLIPKMVAPTTEELATREAALTARAAEVDARSAIVQQQFTSATGMVPSVLNLHGIGDSIYANSNAKQALPGILEEMNALRAERSNLTASLKGVADARVADDSTLSDLRRYVTQYREGFLAAKPTQPINHSVLLSLAKEFPEYFDMTPTQQQWLQGVDELFSYSNALDTAYNVQYEKIPGAYTPHNPEFLQVKADGSVSPATKDAIAKYASPTGAVRKSFQYPRTFDNTLEWLRTLEGADNPTAWNARMDQAIKTAQGAGDLEEAQRLTALQSSGLIPIPRHEDYVSTIMRRLDSANTARHQQGALDMAAEFGDGVQKEVADRMNPAVNPVLHTLGLAAAIPRALIMRFDASSLGVQALSGVAVSGGVKDAIRSNLGGLMRTASSPEEFAKWYTSQADRIAWWQERNMTVMSAEMNMLREGVNDVTTTGVFSPWYRDKAAVNTATGEGFKLGGVQVTTQGKDANVYGRVLNWLDDTQFTRGLTMMKVQTADHLLGLMKAAQQSDGFYSLAKQGFPFLATMNRDALNALNEDQMGRLISEFTNNIYGGRNRIALGRSATHQLVESLFLLTPGFTRGTLHTAVASLKPGAEGALARDYAVRSLALAAGIVTLGTAAANGVSIVSGKPQVVLPNLLDPTQNDWFDIPLPGGNRIRPMARFRNLGQIVFGSLQQAGLNNDPTAAMKYWTDDTLRWFTYRQSALVSTLGGDPVGALLGQQRGNSFARNNSVANILVNPSTNRFKDVWDLILRDITPISIVSAVDAAQQNGFTSLPAFRQIMLAVGSQGLGTSEFGPSLVQSSVASRAAELTKALGMDPGTADNMAQSGNSPVNAKDSAGRYLLTSAQRGQVIDQLSAEFGISQDLAAKGGKFQPRERAAVVAAMESQQIASFSDGVKAAQDAYAKQVGVLDDAFARGAIDGPTYRDEITKARLQRAGGRAASEQANPAAMAYLLSPKYKDRQNAQDTLMNAISAEAFATDFTDPNTGTFDFAAQQANLASLQAKYGPAFDAWRAKSDANKSPTELARDQAMRTLAPYFDIGDQVWSSVVGMTANEREFDAALRQHLMDQKIDPRYAPLLLAQIKQNIPAVGEAGTLTDTLRKALRLTNPAIDKAAEVWLGAQPIT